MTIPELIRKYTVLLLLGIILLGGFLRFYQLATNPPSLNWDEVAFGYNANAILQTGKDEYGKFLPLYWRSLDDYKRPVYCYLTVVSVALFGMTDFAVRFPSAFFGTLTILLVYFLSLEFFKKREVGLLAALLLAIMPWHIQFSHAAFEGNVGFFCMGLGVLLTLYGIRKNLWYLPLASLAYGFAMYAYLAQRISVPIMLLTLGMLYGKKIVSLIRTGKKKQRIPIVIAALLLLVFFTSLFLDAVQPEGNIRFKATSIFNQVDEYKSTEHRMQVDAKEGINIPRRVFHDEPYFTSLELVMRGYLTHFSPDFFFFDKGQQHHHAPGVGLLYIWTLPFLLIGLYNLVKSQHRETSIIFAAWILGPPVAASVTYQIPHALRVGDMILPLMIVIALGIIVFFTWLHKTKKMLVLPVLAGLLIVACVYLFYFFHQYTVHLPEEHSQDWVYGRKEAVLFAEKVKHKYHKVIVSNKLDYPYIFFLYYTKYDPKKYQAEGGTISGGFAEDKNSFDVYEFRTFSYKDEPIGQKNLYIGRPGDFPSEVNPLKKIQYLDGKDAVYIVEGR